MALSQSALLEVLDALNASDSTDVIRKALQVMLQQLIDAEATAFIGAAPFERLHRVLHRVVSGFRTALNLGLRCQAGRAEKSADRGSPGPSQDRV